MVETPHWEHNWGRAAPKGKPWLAPTLSAEGLRRSLGGVEGRNVVKPAIFRTLFFNALVPLVAHSSAGAQLTARLPGAFTANEDERGGDGQNHRSKGSCRHSGQRQPGHSCEDAWRRTRRQEDGGDDREHVQAALVCSEALSMILLQQAKWSRS
jgi:hypothetical protein